MTAADVDVLFALQRDSFRSPWSETAIRDELEIDWSRTMLLREPSGGGVVGSVTYWLLPGEIQLLNIVIDPRVRRRGWGSMMMKHVLLEAERAGAERITLEVRRSNFSALELYRRFGFRPIGERVGYYQEDGEDAVVMSLKRPKAGYQGPRW